MFDNPTSTSPPSAARRKQPTHTQSTHHTTQVQKLTDPHPAGLGPRHPNLQSGHSA